MRVTRLEIDLDEFKNNINKIKDFTNKEIMPVIKANGYGTYINKRLDILNLFNIVAVALVSEGVEIRETGYKGDIFVLNQPAIEDIKLIEDNNLTIGISDITFLDGCIKKNSKFRVHLEIETGMNRTGININDLELFLDKIRKSNLIIEGIYSHLSSADSDRDYTLNQINTFKRALDICSSIKFKYIHLCASSGLLLYDKELDFTNLVRPGLIIYGYEVYPDCFRDIDLKPICRLVSEVTFIKHVDAGSKIGYNQTFTCDIDSSIATVPIGYGDGYLRALSNRGYVYINGHKAPIVGNICMDSIMIDVTGIRVNVRDSVVLFDKEHVTLDELAKLCNTITYELLCNINLRVPRKYIEKK